MKRKKLAIKALWVGVSLLGVAGSLAAKVDVAVSLPPYEKLLAEVGGEALAVRCVQDAGDSCNLFEARPGTVAFLEQAELFLRTGVGYERALMGGHKRVFGDLAVVDLRDAVSLLPMQAGGAEVSRHAGHSAHGEGEACAGCAGCAADKDSMDPHHWMDPVRMGQQLEYAVEALARYADHAEAEQMEKRLEAVRGRLERLDEELAEALEPYAGRAFFIYHPAMGYFADRYGLRQVALAGPSRAPSARQLRQFIELGRELGIGSILVQPQESHKQAKIVAEAIGAEVVEVDPMARDWEAEIRRIGEVLVDGFRREQAG